MSQILGYLYKNPNNKVQLHLIAFSVRRSQSDGVHNVQCDVADHEAFNEYLSKMSTAEFKL